MHKPTGEGWTPERLELLAKLAGDGLSSGAIGLELGVSRNAVIGKLRRGEGLYGSLSPKPKGRHRRTPGAASSIGRELRPRMPSNPKPRALPAAPRTNVNRPPAPPRPTCEPVAFLDAATRDLCLHFTGDPFGPDGPDMPVCGAPRVELSRYCAWHQSRRHDGVERSGKIRMQAMRPGRAVR